MINIVSSTPVMSMWYVNWPQGSTKPSGQVPVRVKGRRIGADKLMKVRLPDSEERCIEGNIGYV